MKTSSRTWVGTIAVSLAAGLFVAATSPILSPTEKITRALSASGAASVKQADADTFLDAFSSVLVSVDETQAATYVAAAKELRPDLDEGIVAASRELTGGDDVDNDAGDGSDHHVSQHHRRCTICCNHHTLHLPCWQAHHKLQNCPQCSPGACDH